MSSLEASAAPCRALAESDLLVRRALTITGSTSSSITLIKGVTISNGACQLSGKRGRAEVLPGACTFVAKGCSPNGRHAILEHKALTEDAQGPAGLRKYVSWQVASGCAAGSLEVPEALEEELNEVSTAAWCCLPGAQSGVLNTCMCGLPGGRGAPQLHLRVAARRPSAHLLQRELRR